MEQKYTSISTQKTTTLLLFLFLVKLALSQSVNYLVNPSFSSPSLTPNSFVIGVADGWSGVYFDLVNTAFGTGTGQFIDLARGPAQNGYLEQNVGMAGDMVCTLSFLARAWDVDYASYVMQVYWNGGLLGTVMGTNNLTMSINYTVTTVAGVNNVKFVEIGTSIDYIGMLLDQASLTCPDPPTPSSSPSPSLSIIDLINMIIASIFSLPLNHIIALKYAYLFTQDVWLYNYDTVRAQGTLEIVFNLTVVIEGLKFGIMDTFAGLRQYQTHLSRLEFKNYTRERFVEIDGSSTRLLEACFSFFVYTVPSNVIACLILYFLFIKAKKWKISQNFRRFYFLKTTLLQTLLEGNVTYFIYICFGHLTLSFSFQFWDRLSLIFTILFMWGLMIFSLGFYFLVGEFLGKKAYHFIFCMYREYEGYAFITVRNLFRNLCRGAIFYFLHDLYGLELLFLSFVEIFVVACAIVLQSYKNIFVSKIFYTLLVTYQLLFILLNLSLYFAYLCISTNNTDLKAQALQLQTITIYTMIANALLQTIMDLVPLNWLRKDKITSTIIQIAHQKTKKISQSSSKEAASNTKLTNIMSKESKVNKATKITQYYENNQKTQNIAKREDSLLGELIQKQIERLKRMKLVENLALKKQLEQNFGQNENYRRQNNVKKCSKLKLLQNHFHEKKKTSNLNSSFGQNQLKIIHK